MVDCRGAPCMQMGECSEDISPGQTALSGRSVGRWWDLTRDFSNYGTVSPNHKGTSSLLLPGKSNCAGVRGLPSVGLCFFCECVGCCSFCPRPSLCLSSHCCTSSCSVRCFVASRFWVSPVLRAQWAQRYANAARIKGFITCAAPWNCGADSAKVGAGGGGVSVCLRENQSKALSCFLESHHFQVKVTLFTWENTVYGAIYYQTNVGNKIYIYFPKEIRLILVEVTLSQQHLVVLLQ